MHLYFLCTCVTHFLLKLKYPMKGYKKVKAPAAEAGETSTELS